ncbi:MAG: DUF4148 domain-containing protein [Comamonadaceae bacterium]|nr:MAG: DUF4148 domain-containing protein [Comamonadaceae bacterium]
MGEKLKRAPIRSQYKHAHHRNRANTSAAQTASIPRGSGAGARAAGPHTNPSLTEIVMNHRQSSIFAFAGTLAAAVLGAAAMTGTARAEGPLEGNAPFTSSRTRAEVQAELMQNRGQVSSYASEYALQRGEPVHAASGYTRSQARAEYIASRDQVQAMNSEHGGAGYFARGPMRPSGTLLAQEQER